MNSNQHSIMKAFADNELFFYLTSDTYSKFFPSGSKVLNHT